MTQDGGLGQPARTFAPDDAEPDVVGGRGQRVLTWLGGAHLAAGNHVLALEARRASEDGPPARTFRVTLCVE